jgi:hypothetical protein
LMSYNPKTVELEFTIINLKASLGPLYTGRRGNFDI